MINSVIYLTSYYVLVLRSRTVWQHMGLLFEEPLPYGPSQEIQKTEQ